jgi:glyoxylase-like metal-dependent hydrolase (beta-lactamase superfamily II)
MTIDHLNCGLLHAPPNPVASCHCLLISHRDGLILIDTGIGLHDIANPVERIGQAAIDAAGYQFHEKLTAAYQIEMFGYRRAQVHNIVLTHADQDHVGGLADFPNARVHLAKEEFDRLGCGRYSSAQFAHQPKWVPHGASSERWFGLESRTVNIAEDVDLRLIPLFGHTLGHCGVAVRQDDRWLLHVGDAYYLRAELETDDHPVTSLATLRADDNDCRRASLAELRRLHRDHAHEVVMFGYHDFGEMEPNRITAPCQADED